MYVQHWSRPIGPLFLVTLPYLHLSHVLAFGSYSSMCWSFKLLLHAVQSRYQPLSIYFLKSLLFLIPHPVVELWRQTCHDVFVLSICVATFRELWTLTPKPLCSSTFLSALQFTVHILSLFDFPKCLCFA